MMCPEAHGWRWLAPLIHGVLRVSCTMAAVVVKSFHDVFILYVRSNGHPSCVGC